MKLKTLFFTALVLISNAVLANAEWQTANLAIVNDHIVPSHQQLAEASQTLIQQSKQLCTSPTTENLDKTRQAFHQTMDGWIGVQHIRFGPVELFSRYHRFQLWPDKHNTGNKQLRAVLNKKDAELLTADHFGRASVAIQGLSALERVLFGKNRDISLFIDNDKANYRCDFVVAVSTNLATMSAELTSEWSVKPAPFHLLFLSSGEMLDERMADQNIAAKKGVTIGFFNNLYTQVQSIIDQKLVRPMGENAKKAKPRYMESWRSQRSLLNITLSLQAVESLYDTGFAPILKNKANGTALNKQIKQAFANTQHAATNIKQPLYNSLKDPAQRPAQMALLSSLRELQSLLTGPLPKALDIPLGFNALDGD